MVGIGGLVVAGGEGPELLEAAHTAFDHVAPCQGSGVKGRRPARPMGVVAAVVRPLGDGVRQLGSPQVAAVARVAVAPVRQQPVRPGARAAPPRPRDADAAEQRGRWSLVLSPPRLRPSA